MFAPLTYMLFFSAMATQMVEYARLEGSWSIDIERTLSLVVPETIEASKRDRIGRALTGTKLQFQDGLVSRTLPTGEIAGPMPYSIRPISDTEFEIAGPQVDVFMVATELTDEALCVRYVAPESSEQPESTFTFECFLRDDA